MLPRLDFNPLPPSPFFHNTLALLTSMRWYSRQDPELPYLALSVQAETRGFAELSRPGREPGTSQEGLTLWGLSGWTVK